MLLNTLEENVFLYLFDHVPESSTDVCLMQLREDVRMLCVLKCYFSDLFP